MSNERNEHEERGAQDTEARPASLTVSDDTDLDALDSAQLRDLVRAVRAIVAGERDDARSGAPLTDESLAESLDTALDAAPDPFSMVAHPKQRAFLRAYAACGQRKRAAEAAGISRSTIYTAQWAEDEAFQDGLKIAEALAAELLEDEAVRRARDGVKTGVGWYKGEPGGYERQYSDTLLIFLMKGQLPEKYGDRLQLKGAFANLDMSRLPDAAVQRIAAGENPMAVLATLDRQGALPAPQERDTGRTAPERNETEARAPLEGDDESELRPGTEL